MVADAALKQPVAGAPRAVRRCTRRGILRLLLGGADGVAGEAGRWRKD